MLKLSVSKQLPLLNQSISQVHRLLVSGELSSGELTRACLQRIKHIEQLNCFITVPEETAKLQATQSEKRFVCGTHLGVLDGIPISFKDNFSTKNLLTTCGSKMLSDYRPPFDATVVERLLERGVVLIGKTNMDEFAMGAACSESYFGATYNPCNSDLPFKVCSKRDPSQIVDNTNLQTDRDQWYIPGGSSGGSAVSVAVGASFAALSSDTGGSTRNPASRVGIVGFKPSYGLISRFGLIPLTHSLDVPGIMARTVEDVAIVFSNLHGFDKRDSTTVNEKIDSYNEGQLSLKNLRIGIPEEYRVPFLSETIVQIWDEVIELLASKGANIVSISLPHTKYSLPCYSILNTCEVASNFACYDGIQYGYRAWSDKPQNFEDSYTSTREESFNDIVKARIIAGNYFLLSENYDRYYTKALRLRRLITEDFFNAFREVDFLLTPTTITDTMSYAKWSQMDKTEEAIKEDYCTQPANMAGLPAISLPVKFDSNTKLPIGLQLIGPKFADYKLLSVAAQCEQLFEFPHLLLNQISN